MQNHTKIVVASLAAFFLSVFCALSTETYTVLGLILDQETGKPVPGATIRVENSNKGAYSTSSGKFRLPFLQGSNSLKVSSIGYQSRTVNVSASNTDTLVIKLKAVDIKTKGVQVVGNIEVNDIIRRAISKKEENMNKLKTFEGTLYSKLVFELDGSVFGSASAASGSISIGSGGNDNEKEKYKMFIMETFSHVSEDYDKHISNTSILQRRQTANLEPQQNLLAIGDFVSFYPDKIKFLNAEMVTPLSSDALSYYRFELIEKNMLDNRYIYVIKVIPNSNIYPLFEGIIKIIEGSYILTEVDLKPSASTAISFVSDLHINQRFMEVKDDLWAPSCLEITGKANVEIIKGLADISLNITASSIYSDVKANEPLPDSIYRQETPRITSVMPEADSAKTEFWEKNSLREISARELEMYKKVDSLVALDTSSTSEEHFLRYNVFPEIGFNRVASAFLGLNLDFSFPFINNNLILGYSFGQKRVLSAYEFNIPLYSGDKSPFSLRLEGSVFNKIDNIGTDDSYHRFVNTFTSAFFQEDYYDYYNREGGRFGFNAAYKRLSLNAFASYARETSLNRSTPRSSVSVLDDEMRPNPAIDEGKFVTLNAALKYSSSIELSQTESIVYKLTLNGLYGERYKDVNPYRSLEGSIGLSIPTFATGYSPMMLELFANAGISSGAIPLQEQFRQQTRLLVFTGQGAFYSAPMAVYGGTEYFSAHASFNLTDMWWRALGLPLYEGRGLDLIFSASTGKYFSSAKNKIYMPTAPDLYSEAGFGISRIPTFISNVGFLAFDARWGVGPLGKGRFGWGIGLTFPF